MKKKRLPKSLRKHIRREKARVHREQFNLKKQEELIGQLYKKISKNHESQRNLQPSNQ